MKHFVPRKSIDPCAGALVKWGARGGHLKSNRVAIAARYMRASTWEFPVFCQEMTYKKPSREDRAADAKFEALSAGEYKFPQIPRLRLRARGPMDASSTLGNSVFESGSLICTFASLDLRWLFSAMKGGAERSSSEQIMCAIGGLNSLLKNRNFDELNLILGMVHPQRSSPELMLTFARLTFPVRDFLSNWFPLVRKIKNELDRRELDSKRLLKGLI